MVEYENLIALSRLFPEGFTVAIRDGKLSQFSDKNRPFIVSHKPLVTINPDKTIKYHNGKIPENGVVGGWLDKETHTYHIELNQIFSSLQLAQRFAKENHQKYIYDNIKGECIKVD